MSLLLLVFLLTWLVQDPPHWCLVQAPPSLLYLLSPRFARLVQDPPPERLIQASPVSGPRRCAPSGVAFTICADRAPRLSSCPSLSPSAPARLRIHLGG
ncbi:hypothetical protein U9M48_013762 [Paspalum notatum var. saurae]|uniref:Secreted protein n=1 Tax=Paspalum notatum var. saurae TaxID=547442 RepID=A0AAQ3T0L0_PASNO